MFVQLIDGCGLTYMAIKRSSKSRDIAASGRLTCPKCRSRLEVFDTPGGAKTVSVISLGVAVERHAKALERFISPEAGPDVICPACEVRIDPAAPYIVRDRVSGRT
jgi:DNA-directed RNA polymerase subunit RPC12/RpoP